jgi:hypothetical protein
MRHGKTIMIVYEIRFCKGLYHDLKKSGQTRKENMELIKAGKEANSTQSIK